MTKKTKKKKTAAFTPPPGLTPERVEALMGLEVDVEQRRAMLRSRLGRVLSRADLANLPKPEPLIDGWLDLRSSVLLIGETGANKTFTALGWACAVATGTDWLGHKVCVPPTPVLYVVGEGAYGLDGRVAAWETHAGTVVPPEHLTIIMQPESLNAPDTWEAITAEAKERTARLVVLDTFSSLAPDADETNDAALMVRHMAELAVALDGTVVLVHHTGWSDKSRARGGSQLEGNPDAVLVMEKTNTDNPDVWDAPVSITRKKVKDGPAGRRLWVVRSPVDLPDFEREQAVLVEAPDVPRLGRPMATSQEGLQLAIYEALRDKPGQCAGLTTLRALVRKRGASFGQSRFDEALALLLNDGLVVKTIRKAKIGAALRDEVVYELAGGEAVRVGSSYQDAASPSDVAPGDFGVTAEQRDIKLKRGKGSM